jgi:hypothetical protein
MSRFRRNRVALTVLAGLALIGLLAIAQSGVAILAVARFGTSFNRIAEKSLPAVIGVSQLSELSQTLVATAPEIALADTQLRRQAITDQLNDRLASLARTVDRVDRSGVDHQLLSDTRNQLDSLVANLRALDDFVRRRIDADNAFETVMTRLPALAGRVRSTTDEAIAAGRDLEPHSDAMISPLDRGHLIEWSAAALEGITLMLASPAVRNTSRLERVQLELAALIDSMKGFRDRLPQLVQSTIDPLQNDVAEFGRGTASIFHARAHPDRDQERHRDRTSRHPADQRKVRQLHLCDL